MKKIVFANTFKISKKSHFFQFLFGFYLLRQLVGPIFANETLTFLYKTIYNFCGIYRNF